MKINKNTILAFIIGVLISGVSVYAATQYLASEIAYNDTTVENALNELYTRTDTTITGLNTQVTNLTNEKDELLNQLNSLTTASKSFTFASGNSPVTINLGFKAGYISCITDNINNSALIDIVYNKDYNSSKVVRISATTDGTGATTLRSNALTDLANWFTINDTSISWNVTNAAWSGKTVYCTASK